MRLSGCSRENELLTALREQRWPDACEPELRSHVAHCSACSEVVLVAQTMQQAHSDATQEATLPSAGILWWRAQVQRRNGAMARVNQPVALATKVASAGTLAAGIALGVWQRHQIGAWFASLDKVAGNVHMADLMAWSANGWAVAMVAAAVGTISLLGGVAVYLAAKRD